MGVVIDVVGAIAIVAVAAGAVAELQVRIGHIGTAADSAAVVIGCFHRGHACFVGSGTGEGDGLLG